jgi:hypothetical protein
MVGRPLNINQAQADLDGSVNFGHYDRVKGSQELDQPPPIHTADLVQPRGRSNLKAIYLRGLDENLDGVRNRRYLGGYGGNNCYASIAIADIILDDERRPRLLDLVAHSRIKRNQINSAPSDGCYRLVLWPVCDPCHASSSTGNHSTAMLKLSSALSL